MTSTIQTLRETLKVPERGRIDFQDVLGSSLSEAMDRWQQGHFPMRRTIVHRLNFDELTISTAGNHAEVIDTRYKATHGVEFLPYKHTYDTLSGESGFEAMQPHFVLHDNPEWVEPHVWAVTDWGIKLTSQAISAPNCLNVSDDRTGGVSGQWMTQEKAIRINFDPPACAVQIGSKCKPFSSGMNVPNSNWPQLWAYNSAGELLSHTERPLGGTLTVSSWADDIAYVIVTVNNHWAGPEASAIFDDLLWTTIEFVLRIMKKLQDAPKPVARGALAEQVLQRVEALQLAQERLHKRLKKLPDLELAAQLQADLAEAMAQSESLRVTCRKITQNTPDDIRKPVQA